MTVGILAVQGAFAEHRKKMEALGAPVVEIRQAGDLDLPFDRLILPGGESTVQRRLVHEDGLFEGLRKRILGGMPTLGTCAGLILLAEWIEGEEDGAFSSFATLPVSVQRNAYGRQLGSFRSSGAFEGAGEVPFTFIRAPRITEVRKDVRVLARHRGDPVAVRQGNQLGLAFHPELDEDLEIHRLFLSL